MAIFAAAGIYQLTPWKDWCLRRCRSPVGALMYYIGFKGRSRDVRVGLHHGATCVGCCWGLMIVLIAVGVMNVAVMAALAIVIFVEKLWRYGKPFGQAVGIVLVAAASWPSGSPGCFLACTPPGCRRCRTSHGWATCAASKLAVTSDLRVRQVRGVPYDLVRDRRCLDVTG